MLIVVFFGPFPIIIYNWVAIADGVEFCSSTLAQLKEINLIDELILVQEELGGRGNLYIIVEHSRQN